MNIFMTFKNNNKKKKILIFSPTESKFNSSLHFIDPKTFCLCAPLAQWNKIVLISPFPLFHLTLFLSLHHYINPPWQHLSYIHSILSSLKPLVLSPPHQLTPAFIYTFPSHLAFSRTNCPMERNQMHRQLANMRKALFDQVFPYSYVLQSMI